MANNLKMSNEGVDVEAEALATALDNGFLRIYDGTQAATADTAIGAQVLLAELRFNATADATNAAGVLTFAAFTGDASANATGTATWFRALKSDGTSPIMDGSVGTSSADLIVNTTSIVAGVAVDVTSWVHTIPKS